MEKIRAHRKIHPHGHGGVTHDGVDELALAEALPAGLYVLRGDLLCAC